MLEGNNLGNPSRSGCLAGQVFPTPSLILIAIHIIISLFFISFLYLCFYFYLNFVLVIILYIYYYFKKKFRSEKDISLIPNHINILVIISKIVFFSFSVEYYANLLAHFQFSKTFQFFFKQLYWTLQLYIIQ